MINQWDFWLVGSCLLACTLCLLVFMATLQEFTLGTSKPMAYAVRHADSNGLVEGMVMLPWVFAAMIANEGEEKGVLDRSARTRLERLCMQM